MTTYLNEYIDYSNKKIAFVPLGTIEWHGSHLPVETDFMVAQKICEILAQKHKAYVLPPIYLGTDIEKTIKGKKYIGMDIAFKKELKGSLFFLKPKMYSNIIESLVVNLSKQGFDKIVLISGHGARNQIKILHEISEKHRFVDLFNPYDALKVTSRHADEYETSLFWACYPEEESRGRNIKVSKDDDLWKYRGYDVREKASLQIGKKMLKEIVRNFKI